MLGQAALNGLLLGALYAAVASGLSLSLGILRMVHLAHGEWVILGAYLALATSAGLGWNPYLGVLAAVPAVGLAGYFAGRWLLVPVRRRGMEPGLIVAFGISVVLQNLLLMTFHADARSLATPWTTASINLMSGLRAPVVYLVDGLAGAALVGSIHWFLHHTRFGVAVRAVGEDETAASLMGVFPARTAALALGVAAGAAAASGVLVGTTFLFYPHSGPMYLVLALAVVVIGGAGRMAGTLLGGILLGLAQTMGGYGWGDQYQALVGYLILLAVLTIRPQGVVSTFSSRYRDVGPPVVPGRSTGSPNRRRKVRWSVWAMVFAVMISLPVWGSRYHVLLGFTFLVYLTLGQMWNLLAGLGGLVSLGQQAFIGLGGYTLALGTLHLGLPAPAAAVLAGLVSGGAALAMSVPLFRTRGLYFSIGTFIAAEALRLAVAAGAWSGGGMGLYLQASYRIDGLHLYGGALALGAISIALVSGLSRSRLGLGLRALRDDEPAARSLGVDTTRAGRICFVLTAGVTGMAAAVFYLNQAVLQPDRAFGMEWTVWLCFMTVIGGMGALEGPALGALLMIGLRQAMAEYPHLELFILGGLSILIMRWFPGGIMGALEPGFASRRTQEEKGA